MWQKIVLLVFGYLAIIGSLAATLMFVVNGLWIVAVIFFVILVINAFFTVAVHKEWVTVMRVFQVLHGIGVVRVILDLLLVTIGVMNTSGTTRITVPQYDYSTNTTSEATIAFTDGNNKGLVIGVAFIEAILFIVGHVLMILLIRSFVKVSTQTVDYMRKNLV